MSRHAGAPSKPWAIRQGGHPLGGGGGAMPMPSSQPEFSSRHAPAARPATSLALPRFMAQPQHSGWQQSMQQSMQRHQAVQQSQPRPAPLAPPPPAAPLRFSQPAYPAYGDSQAPAFAPWSQRSQEDAILVASGLDAAGLGLGEDLMVGDNTQMSQEVAGGAAMVGSAPQAQHQPATAAEVGSQQMAPRPAQAAAKLLEAINRTGAGAPAAASIDLKPLSAKLEVMEGCQVELAAAVGSLQTEVAAQGSALHGIGQACTQLLQAVQTIAGASGTIQERVQVLLERQQPQPRITGDMATQTSPQPATQAAVLAQATQTSPLLAPQPAPLQLHYPLPPAAAPLVQPAAAHASGLLVSVPPAAAAAAQVAPTILRAFNQRRSSSAAAQSAALPPKPTVPPHASAPARRGLSAAHAAAPGAAAAPAVRAAAAAHTALPPAKPTKPTTSSRAARPAAQPQAARRSTRLAESQQQQEQQGPPASCEKAQHPALPAALHGGSQPAQTAPLAAAAVPRSAAPSLASFGRKRRLSTEPEAAAAPPPSQQQQRQQQQDRQPAKRQRQAPASKQPASGRQQAVAASQPPAASQPASRQPSRQLQAVPASRAARRSPPASQAEALFDSLFGEPEAEEAAPPADDLAAAVQRQLARSVARHAKRVARSRHQQAGGGGSSIWLSQPVEDDS